MADFPEPDVWPLSRADDAVMNGKLHWIGNGCDICDENAAASPIGFNDEWPNPGPPCHPSCDCSVEWEWDDDGLLGTAETVNHVSDVTAQPTGENVDSTTAYQYDDAALAMNMALRAGEAAYEDSTYFDGDLVSALDRAAADTPLEKDVMLFRGAAMSDDEIDTLMREGQFQDAGFQSTSTMEHTARGYATARSRMAEGDTRQVVFRLVAPKGTGSFQGAFGNNEVVLERGAKWQILNRQDLDGRVVIRAARVV